jgi:hypothetical protein
VTGFGGVKSLFEIERLSELETAVTFVEFFLAVLRAPGLMAAN